MRMRVLIAGVSTRAAAASAARAGFAVTALDAYGDLDQHPSVRALSLRRDFDSTFTAHAAARASRTIDCDAVAYLSSFENHARAVGALAASGRALWGNSPEVLRRVRDPWRVAESLRARGLPVPALGGSGDARHLVKPLQSGGGHGVRIWSGTSAIPRGCYLQEQIEGIPASIVFVAARRCAVPLGISRQLVGESVFGASDFRYCGNVLAADGDELDSIVGPACDLAQAIAHDFELVGVNGIDFIARDGVPYPIEINPRWSSSMELVERACGISMFGLHAAACARGELPAIDLIGLRRGRRAIGKAIVFAREAGSAPDTASWLNDATIADVPRPGERIERGHPICTVFAEGPTIDACRVALATRARDLYASFAGSQFSVGFSST